MLFCQLSSPQAGVACLTLVLDTAVSLIDMPEPHVRRMVMEQKRSSYEPLRTAGSAMTRHIMITFGL